MNDLIEEIERYEEIIRNKTSNLWTAEDGYGLDEDGNYPEEF